MVARRLAPRLAPLEGLSLFLSTSVCIGWLCHREVYLRGVTKLNLWESRDLASYFELFEVKLVLVLFALVV